MIHKITEIRWHVAEHLTSGVGHLTLSREPRDGAIPREMELECTRAKAAELAWFLGLEEIQQVYGTREIVARWGIGVMRYLRSRDREEDEPSR